MKVLFVMNGSFPYGNAYSSRARNLAKLLVESGNEVHVIAPQKNLGDGSFSLYEGKIKTEYISAPSNFFTLSGLGTAAPYINGIKRYCEEKKPDVIISNNMNFVVPHIIKYAHKQGIKYVIEQCEWFDSSTFKFGRFNPAFLQHILQTQLINYKADGIIAITRLLENHYKKHGLKTLRIPTILDATETKWRKKTKDALDINLVFAGSLGKGKELMRPIFEAISRYSGLIRFYIYGPSKEAVLKSIDEDLMLYEACRDKVIICGRIPQEQIEEKLRESDYSIFIRPQRRSSDAGFPTKLAESMMVGTPVITNMTGDIGLYVHTGDTGYCISDSNSLKNVLDVIGELNNDCREKLRENARICAETFFDYKKYIPEMQIFLNRVVAKND